MSISYNGKQFGQVSCVCVFIFSFCFSFLIDYTINQFICKGYKHRINFISTFANVAVNILGTLLRKKGKITIWQRSPQEAVKVLVLFLRNVYGVIPSHRQIIIADKNIHQVNKHKRRQEQTPSSYMYISVYMCMCLFETWGILSIRFSFIDVIVYKLLYYQEERKLLPASI